MDPNDFDTKIKCPNYKFCKNTGTPGLFACFKDKCRDCDISFGEWRGCSGLLNFKHVESCPICLNVDIKGVEFPYCKSHLVCIGCFVTLYENSWDKNSGNELKCPLCRSV
jgi:hypothetical protein